MAKGIKTGGGSRKGIPNKINSDIKQMILGALDMAGGVNYLFEQSQENPKAFLTLISRVVPREVEAKIETINHAEELERLKALALEAKQKS